MSSTKSQYVDKHADWALTRQYMLTQLPRSSHERTIAYAAAPAVPYLAATASNSVSHQVQPWSHLSLSPDSITLNDIGLTVAFTVFTSQAMYYKETNVQAAP